MVSGRANLDIDSSYNELLQQHEDVRLVYRNLARGEGNTRCLRTINDNEGPDRVCVMEALRRILDFRDMCKSMSIMNSYLELETRLGAKKTEAEALDNLRASLEPHITEDVKDWNELKCIQEASKILDVYETSAIDEVLGRYPNHGIWSPAAHMRYGAPRIIVAHEAPKILDI
ncbi:hypothetical protein Moror_10052 [Moniliophthora roreri MCA 2997]|uniref:Uncharacterized protein n=1 Tax=Moniliophthora roreri (strain MCA 2997) TaxID=1381753 RepID=V2WVD2_MONRO|nr:hypothetical protein Moror_10052 [Moniliophthora roreri MCA 2997]